MKKTLSTLLAIFIIGGVLAPLSNAGNLYGSHLRNGQGYTTSTTVGARTYKSSIRC